MNATTRTTTTPAAIGAATIGAVAAAATLITRRRRRRASAAAVLLERGPAAGDRDEASVDRHAGPVDDDRLTRPAYTRWHEGDRYVVSRGAGRIVRAEGRQLYGSAPRWAPRSYQPYLFAEDLEEVPGECYERFAARTFDVPAAMTDRAHELVETLLTDLQALWDGIPRQVRSELLDDYTATGERRDHPAAAFVRQIGRYGLED